MKNIFDLGNHSGRLLELHGPGSSAWRHDFWDSNLMTWCTGPIWSMISPGISTAIGLELVTWVVPKMVGFPPKSSILIGFWIINHPFWGIFRKPPCNEPQSHQGDSSDDFLFQFCGMDNGPPYSPNRGRSHSSRRRPRQSFASRRLPTSGRMDRRPCTKSRPFSQHANSSRRPSPLSTRVDPHLCP